MPVLDLTVLEDLVGSEADVIAAILAAFRDGAAEARDAMHRAHDAGDMGQLSDAAHKLKSSAHTIGACALGSVCAELEAAPLDGRQDQVNRLLAQFDGELRRVLDELAGR